MEVFDVCHNAEVFHDIVRGEEVVCLKGGESDAVVNEEGKAPTSTRAGSVTTDHSVARDRDGAGVTGQLGLLDGSDPDLMLVKEVR